MGDQAGNVQVMTMDIKDGRKGFTLIEMLITMVVGLIVVGAIYTAIMSAQSSSASVERKISATQDVRAAIGIMESEIRMASYNPNRASNMWKGTDCSSSLNQTWKGIQQATPTSITIEMDISESSVVGDAANEIITYSYDSTNQYITRSTNCAAAVSFLGDLSTSGNPRNVRVVNGTQAVFRYYNGSGGELTSFPNDIPAIRRVEITLIVDTDEIAADTKQRRRTIYTTSVIPRNHAISQ